MTQSVDVMSMGGAHFECTLKLPFSPLFVLKEDDLLRFIFSKRPTLRYKKDLVVYFNQ